MVFLLSCQSRNSKTQFAVNQATNRGCLLLWETHDADARARSVKWLKGDRINLVTVLYRAIERRIIGSQKIGRTKD